MLFSLLNGTDEGHDRVEFVTRWSEVFFRDEGQDRVEFVTRWSEVSKTLAFNISQKRTAKKDQGVLFS